MVRRTLLASVCSVLVLALSAIGSSPKTLDRAPAAGGDRVLERSGGESGEATEARFEALRLARESGNFGADAASTATTVTNPAPGWVGSQLLNPDTDDWEPAVATDPNAPYVYILTTRYGQPKTCSSHCPSPYLALTVSQDGGRSWGAQVPLWGAKGSNAQYDPTIEVVPDTGDVYAAFLNADKAAGFSTVFMRSTNHGETWTAPVHTYEKGWTDKPEVTTSADGSDVYVSWNGQTGGDLWVGVSHDYGATWSPERLTNSKRYYYAYDGKVLPDGTVIFSESSVVYANSAGGNGKATGTYFHHAIISRDGGATWENHVLDKVSLGPPCVSDGCYAEFHTGQTSVSTDANGDLVYAYEGASTDGEPQRVYVTTSSDEGLTWSDRTALSLKREDATAPRLAATDDGDVRLWYMQTSDGGVGTSWNVWYRSSTDGGDHWSAPVKISDADPGTTGYITANGFDEIYGDYGEIAITNLGRTIAVWGEGFSYNGPGGTWFNIQS